MMIQNPVAKNLGWKSMLAWFLAVILTSGMLPTTGFAEEALDPVDATDALSTVIESDQATNKADELGVIEEDGINPDEPILSEYARDEDLLEPEETEDGIYDSLDAIEEATSETDLVASAEDTSSDSIILTSQSIDSNTIANVCDQYGFHTGWYWRSSYNTGSDWTGTYCDKDFTASSSYRTHEYRYRGYYQCQGFARFLAAQVTGSEWDSADWTAKALSASDTLQPGDLIVHSNHSAMVYDVSGGRATFAECWGSSDNKLAVGSYGFNYSYYTASSIANAYPGAMLYRYNGNIHTNSEPPVITNVRVSDVWVSGYTVTCTVADNAGVDRVQFPTWTAANGQDDIAPDWFANSSVTGSRKGNDWTFKVYTADHNYETGWYTTHIYAIDTAGNYTPCAAPDVEVYAPNSTAVIANGRYVLRSARAARMVLDVNGRSQDNQANVSICGWNGGYNQQFDIAKNNDWSYCIYAAHSGKAVEVYGASRALGANVSQYDANHTPAQQWAIQENGDGTYSFRQRVSGLYMDVYGGGTEDGTNVHQWEGNGGLAQKWYLVPVAASQWSVSVAKGSYAYTGGAIKPTVKVTAGGLPLTNGVDYTVSYANNVKAGTATATVSGKGGFTGSKSVSFKITATEPTTPAAPARKDISTASVLRITDMAYTGSAIQPSITVRYGNTTLRNGTHYTLSYSNNVKAGTAKVIVKGKGAYTGTKSVTFKIVKAANPMSAKAVKRTVKHKNVKKNPVAVSRPISVSNPQGKLSYAKVTKGSSKRLTVNKTNGKVTVKKGTKKGTYTIKIKVTASGNANYKSKSTTVTCKVVVK